MYDINLQRASYPCLAAIYKKRRQVFRVGIKAYVKRECRLLQFDLHQLEGISGHDKG